MARHLPLRRTYSALFPLGSNGLKLLTVPRSRLRTCGDQAFEGCCPKIVEFPTRAPKNCSHWQCFQAY